MHAPNARLHGAGFVPAQGALQRHARPGADPKHGARIAYGEVRIFEHWNLTREPALLIGMDALGVLEELIIDYRLHELQLRPH